MLLGPAAINDECDLGSRLQCAQFVHLDATCTQMTTAHDKRYLIIQAGTLCRDIILPAYPPAEIDLEVHPTATQVNLAQSFAKDEHEVGMRLQDSLGLPADGDAPAARTLQRQTLQDFPRALSLGDGVVRDAVSERRQGA